MREVLLFSILSLSFFGNAFVQRPLVYPSRNVILPESSQLAASTTTDAVGSAMQHVEKLIIDNRGDVSIEDLDPLLEAVESQNTYKEPNREEIYKGTWHVWYSNAPPPSNGQLGPFQGSSEQAIATQGDSYKNVLRLPPNSKDGEWLTVVLDGIWEDWDGIEIKEGEEATVESSPSTNSTGQDWGAKFWKVTFLRLNFNLFGKRVLSKDFPAGVARVWRTTYLDNDTRIVRAGRTGRVDDESVFYMKRSPRPSS